MHLIMWQFLSQMLQLIAHQQSILFENQASLPLSDSFTRTALNTITNALTRALQSVNKGKKDIRCCQLKLFECSQHKQILFLNILVFPLFCSPPVYFKMSKSHSANAKLKIFIRSRMSR
jgi:hypothetical protein